MSKDLIMVNVASGGAFATCLAQVEMGLAVLVLLTALYINVKAILRGHKRGK